MDRITKNSDLFLVNRKNDDGSMTSHRTNVAEMKEYFGEGVVSTAGVIAPEVQVLSPEDGAGLATGGDFYLKTDDINNVEIDGEVVYKTDTIASVIAISNTGITATVSGWNIPGNAINTADPTNTRATSRPNTAGKITFSKPVKGVTKVEAYTRMRNTARAGLKKEDGNDIQVDFTGSGTKWYTIYDGEAINLKEYYQQSDLDGAKESDDFWALRINDVVVGNASQDANNNVGPINPIASPESTLTFPEGATNFDKFEVGDVVQEGMIEGVADIVDATFGSVEQTFNGVTGNGSYPEVGKSLKFTAPTSPPGAVRMYFGYDATSTNSSITIIDTNGVKGVYYMNSFGFTGVNSVGRWHAVSGFKGVRSVEWSREGNSDWIRLDAIEVDGTIFTYSDGFYGASITDIKAEAVPPTITVSGGSWLGADGTGDASGDVDISKAVAYDTKLTVSDTTNLDIIDGYVYMTDGSQSDDGSGVMKYDQSYYTITSDTIKKVEPNTQVGGTGYTLTLESDKDLQNFHVGDAVQKIKGVLESGHQPDGVTISPDGQTITFDKQINWSVGFGPVIPSTGKFYFEMVNNDYGISSAATSTALGFCLIDKDESVNTDHTSGKGLSVLITPTGVVGSETWFFPDSGTYGSGSKFDGQPGTILRCCIDADTRTIWASDSGQGPNNWYSMGLPNNISSGSNDDPANGINYTASGTQCPDFSTGTITASYLIKMTEDAGLNTSFTIHYDSAGWTYAPPAGFVEITSGVAASITDIKAEAVPPTITVDSGNWGASNQSQVWSKSLTSRANVPWAQDGGPENAFDGSTETNAINTKISGSSFIDYEPGGGMSYNTLEVYCRFGVNSSLELDGSTVDSNSEGYFRIDTPGSFNTLTMRGSGTSAPNLSAIKVNGELLVDQGLASAPATKVTYGPVTGDGYVQSIENNVVTLSNVTGRWIGPNGDGTEFYVADDTKHTDKGPHPDSFVFTSINENTREFSVLPPGASTTLVNRTWTLISSDTSDFSGAITQKYIDVLAATEGDMLPPYTGITLEPDKYYKVGVQYEDQDGNLEPDTLLEYNTFKTGSVSRSVSGTLLYDENNYTTIDYATVIDNYGVDPDTFDLNSIGIYTLTEQPLMATLGYRKVGIKYEPVYDIGGQIRSLKTRIGI